MGGFPPITDLVKFSSEAMADPTVLPFTETLIKYLGNPLPNYAAMVLMGTTMVFVNKAELLEDFYVKKNMTYSKAQLEIDTMSPMVRNGPFAQKSEDPNYVPQRKILAQAFFKQKMAGMIEIIKSSTIEISRKLRKNHKDGDVIDFIKVATELMSILIVNVCVGHGRAYDMIEQKDKDGKLIKTTLYEALIDNTSAMTARTENPLNIMFPQLNATISMPWDVYFKFNIESLRAKMQTFTDERNKNPKANEEFDDIL